MATIYVLAERKDPCLIEVEMQGCPCISFEKLMNLIAFLSAISLAASVAASTPHSTSVTYLACNMDDRSVVFGYSEQPVRIFDVRYPRVTFSEIKITETHLSFSVKNLFYANGYYNDWKGGEGSKSAHSMEGAINRVTGEGALFFYAEHNPASVAACNKVNSGPWCEYPTVIGSKTGICKQVDRKF